jgi:hypothetical protein
VGNCAQKNAWKEIMLTWYMDMFDNDRVLNAKFPDTAADLVRSDVSRRSEVARAITKVCFLMIEATENCRRGGVAW